MVSIVTTVKDIDRLRQITTVLVRHGFGEIVARAGLGPGAPKEGEEDRRVSFAARLRLVLQDLGPSFVKLGQIMSTRPDLLPADVIAELKRLQDDVPALPFDDVRATIEETLGAPLAELFTWLDPQPLASASIGQVHRARLAHEDAEVEVVVKVQRPRIRATIERDLDLLYFLARVIERAIPESRVYSPVGLVSEFDHAIMAELDFTVEAENAERFARHFAGNEQVRFPHVYRAVSGKRVLVLEYFAGRKIDDAVAAGYSGESIAKNALAAVAQMIYEDGFFHADPHPGNVLILGEPDRPVLGLFDLGLVGRLSPEMRDRCVDLMMAAIRQDPDALADALLAMGRPRGPIDTDAFRAEVARLAERYLGKPLKEVELSALIRDLVQGAVKYQIEMPTEMVMVGKALMTIEGVGKEIYPDLDVMAELRPVFLRLLWKRYHPERLGRELARTVSQLGTTATHLPRQIHTILEDLRNGRLVVRTVDPSMPAATDRLGRRIYASIVVASATLAGAGLLAAGSRYEPLAFGLLAAAALQLLVHLVGDLLHRRKVRDR